jgi:hypothetical protein
MAEAPLWIIFEMIIYFIKSTIEAVLVLGSMFLDLLRSLKPVSATGIFGIIVSFIIIIAVVYFLGKFVFNIGKSIILLFIVGALIFWIILISLA